MTTQSAEADTQFSYEIGYIADSSLSPEGAEKAAAIIKSLIEKAGGTVVLEGQPALRQLAYEIVKGSIGKKSKHKAGYFGWIIFKAAAAEIPGLKTKLDGQEEIIRSLLIRKDRETSVMTPQELKDEQLDGGEGADAPKSDAPAEASVEKPVSKEDIDQKIDNLVIA